MSRVPAAFEPSGKAPRDGKKFALPLLEQHAFARNGNHLFCG